MSHVPFVAIDANESSAFESRPLVAADPLRTQAKAVAIKPATTNEGEGMAPRRVPSRKNGLPTWIAFPLAVSLSFGLSATLYSLPALPGISDYELAKVSRSLNDAWQIGGIVAWKVSEIGIAWSAGLDYLDLLSLGILANVPYYALLHTFYETSAKTLGTSFVIDMVSLTLPFYLLRPLNFYNAHKRTTRPQSVDELAADRSVQLYMTSFAAAIYSLIVYSSFYTWLPVYMIIHFDEVRSLEAAHNAILPVLFVACAPIGYAAKNFLFKPAIASARVVNAPFDPRTATLAQTFTYNIGGESILVSRTILLILFTFFNTFVRVFATVEGSDPYGAAGWGALWSVAALAVGAGFAWAGEI